MLSDRLPEFMGRIKEIAGIMRTEDSEFALIKSAVEKCLNNTFYEFADESESGLDRWEKIYGIPFKEGRPSADRKREISTLYEFVPYTYCSLEQMLRRLYSLDQIPRHLTFVDYLNYTLVFYLHVTMESCLDEFKRIARRWAPANIVLVFTVVYKRHMALKEFTHGQLGMQTHLQIRKEGLGRSLLPP